jgi:hypothetical protein
MSFSQHLVLWLHLAFVVFTIGPVTLAIMSTPRYIRQRDARIVRYLSRITLIFAIACLGVLIAGEALASMISVAGKPWVIVSATLFIVALALLGLIIRDQRKAIKAIEAAAATAPPAATGPAEAQLAAVALQPADGPIDAASTDAATADAVSADAGVAAAGLGGEATASPSGVPLGSEGAIHLASVERGRIAMMGGLVGLIWLVILVLMVWH